LRIWPRWGQLAHCTQTAFFIVAIFADGKAHISGQSDLKTLLAKSLHRSGTRSHPPQMSISIRFPGSRSACHRPRGLAGMASKPYASLCPHNRRVRLEFGFAVQPRWCSFASRALASVQPPLPCKYGCTTHSMEQRVSQVYSLQVAADFLRVATRCRAVPKSLFTTFQPTHVSARLERLAHHALWLAAA
jgi:hypothetical protein